MKTFSSKYFSWYLPHYFYDVKDELNSIHYIHIDTQLLSLYYTSNMLSSCNVDEKYLQKYYKIYDIYQLEQKDISNWIDKKYDAPKIIQANPIATNKSNKMGKYSLIFIMLEQSLTPSSPVQELHRV